MSISVVVKSILFLLFFSFLLVSGLYLNRANQELFSWNKHQIKRLLLVIAGCMLYSVLFAFLPFCVVPYGIIAIVLLLLSGKYIGFVIYLGLSMLSAIMYSLNSTDIIILVSLGCLVHILFAGFHRCKTYKALIIAFSCSDFVLYFLQFLSGEFSLTIGDFILYSCIRTVISVFFIFIFLKFLTEYIMFQEENYFGNISEPDSFLLMELKKVDEGAYYHAIHTAYLSEKMAKKIDADNALAKALGAYHRIGLLQGDDSIQNTLTVLASYQFPKHFQESMKEYGIKNHAHVSKEAAIVQIIDTLVSSVTFLFQKDPNADLDYEKIVDVIIKKKFECNDFFACDLSLDELYTIKKGLTEEKKYYDFLRRK